MADVIEHLEVDGTVYDLPSGGGGSSVSYLDWAQNNDYGRIGNLTIDGVTNKITIPDIITSHPMLRAKCARAGANIFSSTFIQSLEDGSANPYELTAGSSVIIVFGSSQLLRSAAEDVKRHILTKNGNTFNIERNIAPDYDNHQVIVDDLFFKQDIDGELVASGLFVPGLSDDPDIEITPFVGYNYTDASQQWGVQCWAWAIVKNNGSSSKYIFRNQGYVTEPTHGVAVTTVAASSAAFLPDITQYLS